MTPAELRAAGRLGGHAFAGVVSRIEQVHQAVAGRAFGPIRHAGAPARFIHDNVSRSVYLAVRSAGSAAGAMLGEVLSPLGAGGQPASSTPKGNLALSALNAIAGDQLRPDVAPLAIRLAVRAGGSGGPGGLAGLLDRLTAAWPAQVEEVLLIGHSMGGLVIRSACHYGRQSSMAWARQVRHVFYLGSPHLGAPLARAAGFAGWALGQVAETRPFVTLVNGSSSGIKDLRYGYLLPDDWAGCDQDSCPRDHRHDAPLLAGANHYAISATVTGDPGSAVGAVVGDLLVQPASAHGRRGHRQRIPFPAESSRRLGGIHHFKLLNHPAVWAAMPGLLGPAAK